MEKFMIMIVLYVVVVFQMKVLTNPVVQKPSNRKIISPIKHIYFSGSSDVYRMTGYEHVAYMKHKYVGHPMYNPWFFSNTFSWSCA